MLQGKTKLEFMDPVGPFGAAVIVPLQPSDLAAAKHLLAQLHDAEKQANGRLCDAIELRVDQLATVQDYARHTQPLEAGGSQSAALAACFTEIAEIVEILAAARPILLTLRTQVQGGVVAMQPGDYAEFVGTLIAAAGAEQASQDPAARVAARITALDIEKTTFDAALADPTTAQQISALATSGLHRRETGFELVWSHHEWERTPERQELVRMVRGLQESAGDGIAKLAVMPADTADVVRLLEVMRECAQPGAARIIAMAMGSVGSASRVIGGNFGAVATFAALQEASAPGQLSVQQLSVLAEQIMQQLPNLAAQSAETQVQQVSALV